MKKVLFICSTFPWPPTDGETIRSFNVIRELAASTQLTVAHPGPHSLPAELLKALPENVEWVSYTRTAPSLQLKLRAALTFIPVFYLQARSTAFMAWLQSLPVGAFEIIHLDGLPMFNNFEAAKRITPNVVLDLRDSWSLLYTRLQESKPFSVTQRLKTMAVASIERRIVRQCRKVAFISAVDADYVAKRHEVDVSRFTIIPNGINEEFFDVLSQEIEVALPKLAFTGAMDYEPNEQAALFFIERVLPKLLEDWPSLKFFVIGKNPSERLRKLESASVVVTGAVPSVAACLNNIDIVVAPLLSGAGMKNKVVEALAASRPLVASTIAVDGIDINNEKEYLLANSVEEWKHAIGRLLTNPVEARALARDGREKVRGAYSWNMARVTFHKIYDRS